MYAQHYRSWMKRQQTKLPTNKRPGTFRTSSHSSHPLLPVYRFLLYFPTVHPRFRLWVEVSACCIDGQPVGCSDESFWLAARITTARGWAYIEAAWIVNWLELPWNGKFISLRKRATGRMYPVSKHYRTLCDRPRRGHILPVRTQRANWLWYQTGNVISIMSSGIIHQTSRNAICRV